MQNGTDHRNGQADTASQDVKMEVDAPSLPKSPSTKPVASSSTALPTAATAAEPTPQVAAWRARTLDSKQAELASIVDKHDDLVRELFHLDRFVTLIGFDPAVAKQDQSDVFLSFQHQFDLFQHATGDESGSTGRRATRRAATERKGLLSGPTIATESNSKGKGKAKAEDLATPGPVQKGRRKSSTSSTPAGTSKAVEASSKMPAPKAAKPAKPVTKRAASTPTSRSTSPPKSPARAAKAAIPASTSTSTQTLKHALDVSPESARKRVKLEVGEMTPVYYSHPRQLPNPPSFGSLSNYYSSYSAIINEAGGPIPTPDEVTQQADHEAHILRRVAILRADGRTLENPDRTVSAEYVRAKDHQDNLVEQALYFSKLVHEERKSHVLLARKTAKMVMGHFERLKSKDEREAKELLSLQKNLARWTAREVKKKWKLAVNVVRAKRKAIYQAERERIGKEQLNIMLDKSTTMLQQQQSEMIGDASDEEEEESESGSGSGSEESEEDESEEEDDDEEEEEEDQENQDGSEQEAFDAGASDAVTSDQGDESTEPAVAVESPSSDDAVREASPLARSRRIPRARSSLSVSTSAADLEDQSNQEDVDEDVFEAAEDDEARANEDAEMEQEMEAEDEADDEDEDAALAREADMPIEELLRISGYADMVKSEVTQETPPMETDTKESKDPLTKEEREAEAMSEFGSDGDEARNAEDEELEQAMEEEEDEAGSDDSEMAGLAEDADLPIEELMKKYGYGAGQGDGEASSTAAEERLTNEDAAPPQSSATSPEPTSPAQAQDDDEELEEVSAKHDAQENDAALQKVHLRPPFLLRGTLRPYQQAGLEWLASLYASGVNGILADEMGLGKTIQTISLLAHLACDRGIWGPHLVVVPTSVMLNWEMEFKKFLPGFKLITYYGTQKERKEKRKGWNTDNAFHVCVTSYQIVLSDQSMFRRKPWHYMILDEAHHIKNFRSQRWQTLLGFNARHRLLLTGTPLQNNLMELWSLLYFLMPPGLFPQDGKAGPFADHAEFQSWFSTPMDKAIESGQTMDAETQQTVAKLHTILRPYLLRRLKSEVETQMPGKTESVIYCRMSKRQRFLYDEFMSRASTRETLGSGQFLSIINCLMQLRKVCNHPDLFEVRPILTSFSMTRSVADVFEPTELLVRKRLLAEEPVAQIDWTNLRLVSPVEHEVSGVAARQAIRLDAGPSFMTLLPKVEGLNPSFEPPHDTKTLAGWRRWLSWHTLDSTRQRLARLASINTARCYYATPYYGSEIIRILRTPSRLHLLSPESLKFKPREYMDRSTVLPTMVHSNEQRSADLQPIVRAYGCITPNVKAHDLPRFALAPLSETQVTEVEQAAPAELLHTASTKLSIAFPDKSLLQYDCGKLQKLDELLRECKAGGHRALIFTQMTKVLDILEEFLSFHGHRYLRLDGSTKVEQRQTLTERFNSNDKILCFISSTRAGGLGINLQGADTVIFYDSDWNPALDRQCQDRAHRIGQTREVRIWRFVTEHSIEENMLRKANQKRRLDEMVISEGDFTTDYLQKLDWRDYLDDKQLDEYGVAHGAPGDDAANAAAPDAPKQTAAEIRQALAAAEDAEDAAAAKAAEGELQIDQSDFSEQPVVQTSTGAGVDSASASATPQARASGSATPVPMQLDESMEQDPLAGTVDGYMCRLVEEYWEVFA